MKLTHIDDVNKTQEVANHNHGLERVERAVAEAVHRGEQKVNFAELGFAMTPALNKELLEAGLKYIKMDQSIVWGDLAPKREDEDEDKDKKDKK